MLRWKYEDETHETRGAYDTITGERVGIVAKHGDAYHMTMIDRSGKSGAPSRHLGVRLTLQEAQDHIATLHATMQAIQVEQMRRGDLTPVEMAAIALDVTEQRRLLESRAA